MEYRLSAFATLGSMVLLAGGCVGPFARNDPPQQRLSSPPQVLTAAPVGQVTSTPLPPPPGAMTSPLGTDMASVDANAGTGPSAAGSVEVGRTDLLGGWTIASGGDSCQLSMTLTTWSGGYRASTRGCTNPALQKVSAWNMEGRQIMLLDDSGGTVARLHASTKTSFTGQTAGGGPVSFSR